MNRLKFVSPIIQQLGTRSYHAGSLFQQGLNKNGKAALCRVVSIHQHGSSRSDSTMQAAPPSTKGSTSLYVLGGAVVALCIIWKKIQDPKAKALAPSVHIPMVVVGSGTTALRAAQGARLQDPTAKVAIFTDDKYLPYKTTPLLGSLWYMPEEYADRLELTNVNSEGKRRTTSVFHENENYYLSIKEVLESENGGVAVCRKGKVKEIRKKPKQLVLDNGFVIQYDKCVVVSEQVPKRNSNLEGTMSKHSAKTNVTYYHSIEDFQKLRCLAQKGTNFAVLGGGPAACSLAQALMAQAANGNGTQVCQIFEEDGLMGDVLPKPLSDFALKEASQDTKVDMFTSSKIAKVTDADTQICIELVSDKNEKDSSCEVYVDHIVVIDSFGADKKFADDVGLERAGNDRGVLAPTDLYAGNDMWVAGDGVYLYDKQTLSVRSIAGEDQKEQTGRIAGYNMAGGKRTFQRQPVSWGNLSPNASFLCLGQCDSSLKTVSYFSNKEGLGYKGPGAVFYVNEEIGLVVGVMMWNLHGHHTYYAEDLARRILKSSVSEKNIDDLAVEFKLNTFEEFKEELMKKFEAQDDEDDDLGMSTE